MIYADGHLVLLSDNGRLALARATPDGFREKAGVQVLDGRSWTMPTLANGRVFVRDMRKIVCLDLREGG